MTGCKRNVGTAYRTNNGKSRGVVYRTEIVLYCRLERYGYRILSVECIILQEMYSLMIFSQYIH